MNITLKKMSQIVHRNVRILIGVSAGIILFYVLTFHFGTDLPKVSTKSFTTHFSNKSPSTPPKSFSEHIYPKEQFLKELHEEPLYKLTGFNLQPTNPGKIPYNTTVLQQLQKKVPYDPTVSIPKTIWQMWKVPLDHEDFPTDYRDYHQTWLDKAPNYEHIFKTNEEYDTIVNKLYSDVPEVLHAYNIMPQTILKCDFSRYLLLYAYGGIYADLDTILWKPIDTWITNQKQYLHRPLEPGIIVGIENEGGARINNWTILSKKGHPMLAELINQITEHTLWREETGQLNAIFRNLRDNVIDWTGPGRFTDMTYKYLNNILQTDFDRFETIIEYPLLEHIRLPFVLGDIMVLPGNSMRAEDNPENDPLAYISHKYAGAWKIDQDIEEQEAAAAAAENAEQE